MRVHRRQRGTQLVRHVARELPGRGLRARPLADLVLQGTSHSVERRDQLRKLISAAGRYPDRQITVGHPCAAPASEARSIIRCPCTSAAELAWGIRRSTARIQASSTRGSTGFTT